MLSWIPKFFTWLGPRPSTKNFDHKVNADISVVPLGTPEGASISKYTRKAGEILSRSGLTELRPHAFGTNISGNWSQVKTAIERIAENQLNELKVPRLSINLKLSFRQDKDQTIAKRLNQ